MAIEPDCTWSQTLEEEGLDPKCTRCGDLIVEPDDATLLVHGRDEAGAVKFYSLLCRACGRDFRATGRWSSFRKGGTDGAAHEQEQGGTRQ